MLVEIVVVGVVVWCVVLGDGGGIYFFPVTYRIFLQ